MQQIITAMSETALEKMVERVEWMVGIHYEILEFFDEKNPISISPRDLSVNIGYSKNYAGDACRDLTDAGLLQRSEENTQLYELTDRGRAFLQGEVDPDDLPDPTT